MPSIEDVVVQNVLQGLPVGLLVIGASGEIHVANPAATAILGHSRDELLARGWGELFLASEANDLFNQVFVEVVQQESVGLTRDVPYERPDGSRLHLTVTSSFLRSGADLAVVVILHDVTEIFQMRERELAILTERGRLQQEKIAGLNNLAMSVAHQIRNPAFAIGGFSRRLAELLSKNGLQSDYPGIITDEVLRLERIVTSVVRLASLPGANPRHLSLAEAAQAALGQAQELAASRGLGLTLANLDPKAAAVADPTLLALCLGELFTNSVDFARGPDVRIELAVAESDGFLDLAVADNGPGIDQEIMPFVFDPFFSTKADGVGMGLTVARSIALEHGGELRADDHPGPGARFVLRLRRVGEEDEDASGGRGR